MKSIIKNIISNFLGHKTVFQKTDKKILSLLFAKGNENSVFFTESEYENSTDSNKILISNSLKKDIPSTSYHYINNNDGTIRWIFSSKSKKPNFLKFYNINTFRSKLLSSIIKSATNLGLIKYVSSGTFQVYSESFTFLEKFISKYEADDHAIFTGTTGPNRKLLLWLESDKTSYYIKIPTTDRSRKLIKNEVKQANFIQSFKIPNLKTPNAYFDINNQVAILEDIASNNSHRKNKLTELHLSALNKIYESSNHVQSIEDSTFWKESMDKFKSIKKTPFAKELKENLTNLINSINTTEIATFSLMHGDFTLWNMYIDKDKLCLYDWELSEKRMPLYFDIFHFIMQKNILVYQNNYETIKSEISAIFTQNYFSFINKHSDWVDYYKGYLIHNTIYNLQLFEEQKNLHPQAYWLMNTWNEAIKNIEESSNNKTNQKDKFTDNLFNHLKNKDYALLKFSERSLKKIPNTSDLDILINPKDKKAIIEFIATSNEVHKININSLSFASFIEVLFTDEHFLRIDLIHQFKRKSIQMFDSAPILENTSLTDENIKIPAIKYDFEYCLLFYFLNKSGIPQKYIDFFSTLTGKEKDEIKNHILGKYNLEVDFDNLNQHSREIENSILTVLTKDKSNTGLSKIKNKFKYLKDTIKNTFLQKGMIITFSGVDGAGKSTIIESAKKAIQEKYRKKLVVLRHRPSILPILSSFKYGKKNAELRAATKLPRQGINNSTISSTLRFTYYFTDYLFGQIYIYIRYVCRGYIVLYDRYYFDFINDAKRSNIKANKKLVKFLYHFVYKPDLNFFLYADPEIILSRKKELKKTEINTLTKSYSSLFDEYQKNYSNSKYVQIKNINLDETIDKVMYEFGKAV